MSLSQQQEKLMKNLIEKIEKYNFEYYTLDNPTVSDKEYDEVYYRLVDLEKETGVILPNSPTQRVGGEILDKFEKHKHEVRLYSLSKVRDFADLENWVQDMRKFDPKTDFALEYKFDGLQLVLEYENGKFQRATTRGNGEVGENVTEQVKTIKSVPLEIAYKKRLILQGEGMMTKNALKIFNRTAEIPLKNARNGVAGAIRNLDPKETAKRRLTFFAYSILFCEEKFSSQQEMHNFLLENGFDVGEYFKICHSAQEIESEILKIGKIKDSLQMEIDGMVLKVNNVRSREEIGYTNKFPKWAMAFKFEAEEVSTMLLDVIWQVGRSGKVSPIAILQPVQLAGATVQRATLNNIEDIRKKHVLKNSRIFVRRSNEVIPEVLGLAERFDFSTEIEEPQFCPSCHSKLVKKGPLIFCKNHDGCKEQIVSRLTHFVSRDAFNIEGLSEKSIAQFYEDLGIRHFSDLFQLSKEQLVGLEKFADKKAENVLQSLQNAKNIEFFRFLYALGISEVGIKTARDLSKKFVDFESIKNASVEDVLQVEDVGEIIAANIVEFFADEENLKEINLLFSCGVTTFSNNQKQSNKLDGLSFVLTGTLPNFSRSQMSELIEANGGKTSSSVSKNTSFVLAGEEAGSKLDKAKALGIAIISEEDLLKMLK